VILTKTSATISKKEEKKVMIPSNTLQARLLKSLARHRDRIALAYRDTALTYDRLHRQSDEMALWLAARGIEAGACIGIMVQDKAALVTVILAIVKAGGVFVPLDIDYPDRRSRAMLQAVDMSYLFCEEDAFKRVKGITRALSRPVHLITIDGSLQLQLHRDRYKLSEREKTRYSRQLLLDGWGLEGQERLKAATVFVAGAGGSGSPLIQQLALCGFGSIIICDYDSVELSNLNRQSLHDESRLGMNKALSAKMTVERLNPHVRVIAHTEKIDRQNVFDLVGEAEIIFDNVDSLEAKALLSECAVHKGIPHIISSMIHINAYACIFFPPRTPCFHCLYDRDKIRDIGRAKTLTRHYEVIPNSVASPALYLSTGFAVNEAIKILLGMGEPAYNIYFHFNQYGSAAVTRTRGYQQITYPFSRHFREISRRQGFDWDSSWQGHYVEEIAIEPDPDCPVCGKKRATATAATAEMKAGPQQAVPERRGDAAPVVAYSPDDRINVYFTSGTGGEPRAVLGRNESLLQFIAWEIDEFAISEEIRVSQFTPQCHDPFLRDVFVPLCAGGTLCIPDSRETMLDTGRMVRWLEERGVQLIHCTPSLFKILNANGLLKENLRQLKYVLLAGERIVPTELTHWYRVFGSRIQLVNIYGPTETTLAKMYYLISPEDIERDNMPIGKPIKGARVILLDRDLNICRSGEVGEIYIRTPFRSYGYANDPQLTARRFIKNPFNDDPADLIYRTGDLGKMNDDGSIEFVGRQDRQVKIRGFRVEPEGIENTIRSFAPVQDAAVHHLKTGSGNHILVAYIIPRPDFGRENGDLTAQLKTYLSAQLPDYMIPTFIIEMAAFPLSANRKIDYRALPQPDEIVRQTFTPPKNEGQRKLAAIWTDILGIQKIGIHDGFLDMGGNSLNAMNLASRLYREFAVNLPLSRIFENPTIAELAEIVEQGSRDIYRRIEPVEKREYYPLSSSQMRMYLLKEFAGTGETVYNMPKPLLLEGELDRRRLDGVFRELIRRHQALRTGFGIAAGEPVQRIWEEVEFEIRYGDSDGSTTDSILRNFVRAFDLSRPPLFRVGLFRVGEERHILAFDIHHIISDGQTTGIIIEEFIRLYRGESLRPLRIQYRDYAAWQQRTRQSGVRRRQEEYWLRQFAGDIPVLDLTTDYPRPPLQHFDGATLDIEVEDGLIDRLQRLARRHEATLFTVLLSAYFSLLHRYTGQDDIVVGSPIAGRPHDDLGGVVGIFINTLALRSHPFPQQSYRELLAAVKESAFQAFENQDYPFEELVEKVEARRNLDRNPLFDTLFIMQNIDQPPLRLEGLTIVPCDFDSGVSRFDLTLIALQTEEGFRFSLEYSTHLFRQETMRRLAGHFVNILKEVAEDPGVRLGRLDLLTEAEKRQLILDFNRTAGPFPEGRSVHQLFAHQVSRTPDAAAVTGGAPGQTLLTYAELQRHAAHSADRLKGAGMGGGDIVGLMVRRSPQMLTALLGILESGAACLPLDPDFPGQRIRYMLKDSRAAAVITTEGLEIPDSRPGGMPEGRGVLAYVIYTSGSTGRPKGVAVSHHNVVNFIAAMGEKIAFSAGKTILALTTVSFDIFVLETLLPLTRGLKVVIADEEQQRDPERLGRLIQHTGVDMLQVTPSRLQLILQDRRSRQWLPGLTELIIGGEALPPELFQQIRGFCPRVYNVYGPSETTVWSSLKDLSDEQGDHITIGRPILNTSIFILDRNGSLLPLGAAGELHIGGCGVAVGYLNNPELTAERFVNAAAKGRQDTRSIKNKILTPKSQILYRTGDLCRFLPDGEIEFLGRLDHQVKIRGFRIETGEIESHLTAHPAIAEAVVVASEIEADTLLCAYIVPQTSRTNETSPLKLRQYLSRTLPNYMIPAFFVSLEAIPLTANGKIDRRGLPAPGLPVGRPSTPPRNRREAKLAEIWGEMLSGGDRAIGIDDNFFELGGHSLKATLILGRLQQVFAVTMPLAEMFKRPTIREMAGYIAAAGEDRPGVVPTEQREYYAASFHQKRLWILHARGSGGTAFHMTQQLRLPGGTEAERIEDVLYRLMARHESLRTGFIEIDDQLVQRVRQAKEVRLPFRVADVYSSVEAPFDLTEAPLWRAALIKLAPDHCELIFTIHHIVCDAWSLEILRQDFFAACEGCRENAAVGILAVPRQYRDFSGWHNCRIDDPLRRQAAHRFWQETLAGDLPLLELPMALLEGRDQAAAVGYTCRMTGDTTLRLKRLAAANRTTLTVVMLAAYIILLSQLSGQDDILCALVSAGRDDGSLQRTVGCFIQSLLLRVQLDAEEGFFDFIRRLARQMAAVMEHQDYPLELVLDELHMAYPPVGAAFNMLNIPSLEDRQVPPGQTGEGGDSHIVTPVPDAKFDVECYIKEHPGGIDIFWSFRRAMFDDEAIAYIADAYIDLLAELSEEA
jgi:amino acid adenylation domain-containing protein